MNWKKIKTILIVILVITDVILFYNYIRSNRTLKEVSFDSINTLYLAKGVEIDASVDVNFEKIFGIESSAATMSSIIEQNIIQYFDKYNTQEEFYLKSKDRSISYIRGDIIDSIENSKSIVLDSTVSEEEKKEFLEKSRGFFESINVLFEPGMLKMYDLNGIKIVRLYQLVEHKESVLGSSEISTSYFPEIESIVYLFFDENRVVGVNIEKLMNIYEGYTNAYDIISVEDAIYRVLARSPENDRLLEINIVYKLNDESLLASDLVMGEMLPYYEFVFENNSSIYLRATK